MELLGRGAAGCGPEIRGLHQAVAVAVEVEYARTGDFETAAGVSLRVKFDQLQFVAGEAGNEGNVVVFGHGVVDGDEKLIFHPLQRQLMVFVGVVRLRDVQRRQGDAAAAHDSLPGGVEHIAAQGADVELGAKQVGRTVPVDDGFALHQLEHADAQSRRQRLQQGNIGQAVGCLPLGDGLCADGQLFGQLCLRQVFGFPQLPDGSAGDVRIHKNSPL